MTPATVRTATHPCDVSLPPNSIVTPVQRFASVVTRMTFSGRREAIWRGLLFYEQIRRRPPLLLRLLLPLPVRTDGSRSGVGEDVVCHYRGGRLLKRLTRIEPGHCYEFDVIEQTFKIGGGLTLLGGGYRLVDLSEDRTEVTLVTRYTSPHRPRWLCERIEAGVCHTFHRHILEGIRDNVSS